MLGYKTYIVSVLTAVLGALVAVDWVKFFDDPKAGWAIVGMSVLMAVMRGITQATTVKAALETPPPAAE